MSTASSFRRQPVYYLTRAGAQSPDINGQTGVRDRHFEQSIVDIPRQLLKRPDAILFVSGDWEEPAFTISSFPVPAARRSPLDAHPQHNEADRAPLSRRVRELLDCAALPTNEASVHRIDGNALGALTSMYPDTNVPVVRLSLRASLDPAIHWAAGHALARLRDENVLIIGCSSRDHEQNWKRQAATRPSAEFDLWLRRALLEEEPSRRIMALLNWESAPAAHIVHPRGNSLMPLLFIAGTAGNDPAICIADRGRRWLSSPSSYRFGQVIEKSDMKRMWPRLQ
ncbi:dioxygenase [Burkholderia sp. BCC1981]|uniref:dioxygenase family protein n=1 Tax=unclassified Burkholderia TaxID=2613784 RepID=UPI0039F21840